MESSTFRFFRSQPQQKHTHPTQKSATSSFSQIPWTKKSHPHSFPEVHNFLSPGWVPHLFVGLQGFPGGGACLRRSFTQVLRNLGPAAASVAFMNQEFRGEDVPGTPSVLFFKATLPLKPATIALKIGYLAFQVLFLLDKNVFFRGTKKLEQHFG